MKREERISRTVRQITGAQAELGEALVSLTGTVEQQDQRFRDRMALSYVWSAIAATNRAKRSLELLEKEEKRKIYLDDIPFFGDALGPEGSA